jgi:catechol 2,3-dioxygenase-like lactoylglutathione lyase family enzyme
MVQDRERSKAWYRDQLGFDVISDSDHWITVGRKGQGGQIHLCQVSEAGEGATLEPGNTGILIYLRGKLQPTYDRLLRDGVKFSEGVTKRPWGTYCMVVDPDGNELILMEASE